MRFEWRRAGLLLGASALLVAACRRSGDGGATGTGSARMVDTLRAIRERAAADPEANAFLNRERAAALARIVPAQTGAIAVQNRYRLAHELLLAGQTREAITELSGLIAGTRSRLSRDQPQAKILFDLLAIAYLRLGEQQNCLTNPSADVCILPLSGEARHKDEEGARKAIALYQQILTVFPDDRGSQWLLNMAYLAVGGYPYQVPPAWRIPGIGPTAPRAFPLFRNVAPAVGLAHSGLSGGLAVADFNGDGLLDLFTTSWGLGDPAHLFIADGAGGYTDRASAAGLDGITGGLNVIHADYDNDGDEDVLVLRGAWLGEAGRHPNSLLRNNGDGTFTDVTYAAGLGSAHPTHSAAWADFNLDGLLDLFVGNESAVANGGPSHPSELFLNNGDGTFTDVAAATGLVLDAFVKGVVWGDVNNDGLPDLYASVLFGPNRLFLNRGGRSAKSWKFEELADAGGASGPNMSFPVWFWDYDQDGWEDLMVLSYDIRASGSLHEAVALEYLDLPRAIPGPDGRMLPVESSRLYRNDGKGRFVDVSAAAGLADKVIFAMGTNFGDADNDGWLDMYIGTGNPDLRSVIPNRMLRHDGVGRFMDVSLDGGFAHIQKGHGAAFADFDRDGDEDVFMVMGGAYSGDVAASVLFENPGFADRSWITLRLEGRQANRNAIGARVELIVADAAARERTLHRTVGTGGSFGAGPTELHVGLGSATRVVRATVQWPDAARTRTEYGTLAPRSTYRIVQGSAPVRVDAPVVPFRKSGPTAPHQHSPQPGSTGKR